jgi:hypothetical protein
MSDLAHEDPVLGRCIVTFDGRVLELFTERAGSDARLIAGMLHVDVSDPDRKGRREVTFSCAPRKRGGGFRLWVPQEQWDGVAPFVDEVAAAVA